MSLAREIKHFKTLVGSDKCIYHSGGVRWVNIVIDITMNKQKSAFQVLGQFVIFLDAVLESGVTFLRYHLFNTMVSLTPPAVVDAVVVVTAQDTATL